MVLLAAVVGLVDFVVFVFGVVDSGSIVVAVISTAVIGVVVFVILLVNLVDVFLLTC